jgi:hypothetical protein
MKLSNLFETKNPGYKSGEPYWELDIDNKVYTVHSEDGTEVASYPFQHVWDSSPAKRQAQAKYSELYKVYFQRKKADDEAKADAKPLSSIEKKYYDLSKSVEKYNRLIFPKTPEDNILDKETRDLYMETSMKWMKEMERLASGGTIRKSVIAGTYKPAV